MKVKIITLADAIEKVGNKANLSGAPKTKKAIADVYADNTVIGIIERKGEPWFIVKGGE